MSWNKIFTWSGQKLISLGRRLEKGVEHDRARIQYERCLPWFAAKGDATLRLDYELDQDSVVFDMGGYEGQWAADIFIKYHPFVYVFEPHPGFASAIRRRFSSNEKVRIFEYGLSNNDKEIELGVLADSSSLFKKGSESIVVKLRSASDFISEFQIPRIDLMKINIEGGEYDLLEHLIETGLVKNITNIQVQFHDFVPNARGRMNRIQEFLSKTHVLTYQYEFVWENWKKL